MFSINRLLITFFTFFLAISNATAFSVNYSIEGGVYNSDNIRIVETDQQEDTVGILSAGLEVVGQSSTNDVSLLMNIERREYKNDTFVDDTRGLADLKSNWGIVDKILTWTIDGFYGQARIDPYAAITPDNLQNVGYYSTGPNLNLLLTAADIVNISAHYNGYYAEIDNTDNNSNAYSISYTRKISPVTSFSLNTDYYIVKYDDATYIDFDRFDYYLNFTRTTSISDIRINYGTSDLEFNTGQTLEGDYKRLSSTWNLNRSNSLQFGLADELDDGASSLNGGTVSSVIAAGSLFRNQEVTFGYLYKKDPVQLRLAFKYADEDYLAQNDFDRKIRTGNFSAIFGQEQNVQFTLTYFYDNFDYYVLGQEDIEKTISLRLSKRIGSRFSFGLQGQRFNRESTAQTQDVTENQIMFFMRYQSRNR